MSHCKTCKHWTEDHDWELANAGVCQAAKQLWAVTERSHDDYYTLVLKPGHHGLCFVQDGSNYCAELVTMPDFGCVQHEAKE